MPVPDHIDVMYTFPSQDVQPIYVRVSDPDTYWIIYSLYFMCHKLMFDAYSVYINDAIDSWYNCTAGLFQEMVNDMTQVPCMQKLLLRVNRLNNFMPNEYPLWYSG